MKAHTPIVIALLVGFVLGGIGGGVLCNQGYCGNQTTIASDSAATRTANALGVGASSGDNAEATPVSTSVDTDTAASESPTPTPSNETAGGRVAAPTGPITGLAVIGDSTADEYRADNPRGGEFGATTFNWVELLANERGVNFGEWGLNRPDSRRSGYAYNWARSGATSQSMINNGQHTGIEKQIRTGEVSHVIIQIGINDFYYSDAALGIYEGLLTGAPLQQFLDGIITNISLAVQMVKAAGEDHVILAATQDYVEPSLLPEVDEMLSNGLGRQAVIDAFAYLNEGLRELAAREDVPFFDFNAALQRELEARSDPDDPRFIIVGGERLDLTVKSNDPDSVFLGDEYAHPGTVFSGLIANLFITEMNEVFDAGITPFSDDEILQIAGLK